MKFVSIIMGSKSDYEVVSECAKILKDFGVAYEMIISSAHRSPKRTAEYVANAEKKAHKFLYVQPEWRLIWQELSLQTLQSL